ncbi:MAG: CopG family transcriptional regulator [Chloroflexota bacterium]
MTKRLQVLLEDEELAEIQALARRRRQTTAAWVRDALRAAFVATDYPLPETKLRAVREAAVHLFPSGNIDEMLGEIERGQDGVNSESPDPAPSSTATS